MKLAAMATMPERVHILEKSVASLRPQVDAIRVYLNNFDERPSFLSEEEAILSKDALGDIGAEGKFYWYDQGGFDYYLTVDDDLLYPPDYVERLVNGFEARRGKAIVGVHGFVFDKPIESYTKSRAEKYKCTYALTEDRPVHVIGTATTILGPTTIKLSLKDFPVRNTVDLQLAITAQRQHIPLVVLSREENWIQELQDPEFEHGFTIWKETKQNNGQMKAALANKAISQWQLLPDPIKR